VASGDGVRVLTLGFDAAGSRGHGPAFDAVHGMAFAPTACP